jgi:hypothetical protein
MRPPQQSGPVELEAGQEVPLVLSYQPQEGSVRLMSPWSRSSSTQPVDGVLTYDEGLFIGYRAYDRDEREPLYPFCHGLGYTNWEYVGIGASGEVAGGLICSLPGGRAATCVKALKLHSRPRGVDTVPRILSPAATSAEAVS